MINEGSNSSSMQSVVFAVNFKCSEGWDLRGPWNNRWADPVVDDHEQIWASVLLLSFVSQDQSRVGRLHYAALLESSTVRAATDSNLSLMIHITPSLVSCDT